MNQHDAQPTQEDMWAFVTPGSYVEIDGIGGHVVSIDHEAETVDVDLGEGVVTWKWDDVGTIIINQLPSEYELPENPDDDPPGPAGDFGPPTGTTLVYTGTEAPTRELAILSLDKVVAGDSERVKDATAEFLHERLLTKGDRFVANGIVYETTWDRRDKNRWTVSAVGILVDDAVARRQGVTGPGKLEKEIDAAEAKRPDPADVLADDCACFEWDNPERDGFGHAVGCTLYQGDAHAH